MKIRNTMMMILLSLCTADAYAMLAVRKAKCQTGKQKKRISVVSAKTYFDFQEQIENVGLRSCSRTFTRKREACFNKLCCKDAYPVSDNLNEFQCVASLIEAQRIRDAFLQQVDKNETGRVQAAKQIQLMYNKLVVIEKEIKDSGLQEGDTEPLLNSINHQKKCLFNQFRIIADASPVIEERWQYKLAFTKSGNPKIEKISILAVPVGSDKE